MSGLFRTPSCDGTCVVPAPPPPTWPPPPPRPPAWQGPNILFILSDDLGFNDISLHGSPQIPTPHIDALARAGVTLMNYHANPSCSPTRASIMTGRSMIHHGVFSPFGIGNPGALDEAFTLLPQYVIYARGNLPQNRPKSIIFCKSMIVVTCTQYVPGVL